MTRSSTADVHVCMIHKIEFDAYRLEWKAVLTFFIAFHLQPLSFQQQDLAKTMTFHVSITGIKLKSVYNVPAFRAVHKSIPSLLQAEMGLIPGLVKVESECSAGFHYTMCMWEDRSSMNWYLCSLQYMQLLKLSMDLGVCVKEYTFKTNELPTLTPVLRHKWDTKGRVIFQHRKVCSIPGETGVIWPSKSAPRCNERLKKGSLEMRRMTSLCSPDKSSQVRRKRPAVASMA
jgi:hypothetical protein